MNTNKYKLNFQRLIELFERTHNAMQAQAARSVDIALVVRNWLFGWYIVEFENGGAERAVLYGKALIDRLSEELIGNNIRGVSPTNLRKFRKFYKTYIEIQQAAPVESFFKINFKQIQQALPVESFQAIKKTTALEEIMTKLTQHFILGWTHYVALLSVKSDEERKFYEIEAIQNGWSYRELERQINSCLYERLALSRDKEKIEELSKKGHIISKSQDIVKSPYILEFLGLEEHPSYSENEFETAIINKIEHFLLELGKGFLFEARQKRFSFDNRHFYVDLVFYNRLLRSYVLVDLKVDDLKHQDLGQMLMYVNYFDRYVKTEGENSTIGILLCHSKSDDLVELTLPKDSNIHASEYQLYLPSKEELQKQLKEVQKDWEEHHRK